MPKKAINAKKVTTHNTENSMYFRMSDPIGFRKEILKSAIDVARLLRRFESYKGLRHLTHESYASLNGINKQLTSWTDKLITKDLPVSRKIKEDLRKFKKLEGKETPTVGQIATKFFREETRRTQKSNESELTEQEKLDQELSDIESKLRKLDI